jgi:tripeptide aminopeptidase
MADRVRSDLEALGLSVREDGTAEKIGGNAGNLFTELAPSGEARRWITLSAHLDAVPPGYGEDPYIDGEVIRSRGRILSADDRAGVAMILELLDELRRDPLGGLGVQAIFSVAEETGPIGSRHIAPEEVKGDMILVLDTAGSPGQLNTASPHAKKFRCTFRGRAAHAGVEPEKGINALVMAAAVAGRIPSGRLDADTTFSFTVLHAGTSTNVIPAEAILEGETRSFREGEVDRLLERLEEDCRWEAREGGGSVEIQVVEKFPPFHLGEDHPLVQGLVRAAEACGFRPEPRRKGGGSDANIFNQMGIPAVNLAVGYRKGHCPEEHLVVSDFEGSYRWVLRFLRDLDR